MAKNKFLDLSGVGYFLDKCKDIFASITHEHTLNEITDYTIDAELSSTSANPVENKIIKTEIDRINNVIDTKADSTHDHNDVYYTKSEIDSLELITTDEIDSICEGTIEVVNEDNAIF